MNKYIDFLSEGESNELQNEFIEDLKEVHTETVKDIEEIKGDMEVVEEEVEVAPRRSGRTKKGVFYGELLNERIIDNWNTKYEIYSSFML